MHITNVYAIDNESLDKENMSANMNSKDRNCQLATVEILQPGF